MILEHRRQTQEDQARPDLRIVPKDDRATPPGVIPAPANFPSLADVARQLVEAQIAFLPILGNNADTYKKAKEPFIKWRDLKHRLATVQEVQSWLHDSRTGGVAIINGNLSRLISIDTDTDEAEAEFCDEFAELLSTYTERTPRGGKHRFYRLPAGTKAPGVTKIPDYGELRGEGGYTVIAGTRWRDMVWTVEYGDWTTIHTLTPDELDRLQAFYQKRVKYVDTTPKKRELSNAGAIGQDSEAITSSALEDEIMRRLGATDFDSAGFSNPVHCPMHDDEHPSATWNRNKHALMCHAGCTSAGFKPGWVGKFNTAAALGIVIEQRSSPLSAVTVKAILQRWPGKAGDTVARVLLVLLLSGYTSGRDFTEAQAVKVCGGIVGRHGVRAALEKLKEFCSVASKLQGGVTNTSKDTCLQPDKTKKRGGRPATYYTMPSEDEIAAVLGVKPRGALSITLDELKSRALTDLLLEKQIARQPGVKTYYKTLAAEYGKAPSTMRRYATTNPLIQRKQTYSKEIEITTPEQVAELTNDSRGAQGGRFVENQHGERFPAYPQLVEMRLERGDRLTFYEVDANEFSLRNDMSADQAERQRQAFKLKARALRLLGQQDRAGKLRGNRAELRAKIRRWAEECNLEALEAYIEQVKSVLKVKAGQGKSAPIDPVIETAKALGGKVKGVSVKRKATAAPLVWKCPDCGQGAMFTEFGSMPDICPHCQDIKTWWLIDTETGERLNGTR